MNTASDAPARTGSPWFLNEHFNHHSNVNEAANIAEMIRRLQRAAARNIVDGGSSDSDVELAKVPIAF